MKKPGEISSNTLNLRFMQTATKTRQEREIEDARRKVKTEEEWELTPELRERWGVDRQADVQARVLVRILMAVSSLTIHVCSVSYEPSYLPFVFPGFPSSSKHTAPVTRVNPESDESNDDGESFDKMAVVSYTGRRKFGKYGKEQTEACNDTSCWLVYNQSVTCRNMQCLRLPHRHLKIRNYLRVLKPFHHMAVLPRPPRCILHIPLGQTKRTSYLEMLEASHRVSVEPLLPP
jgi:hypothetical protein